MSGNSKFEAAAPAGNSPNMTATVGDSSLARVTTRSLLGVDYSHLTTADGGELYLTRFGLPFWKNLLPENWYAREWFEAKRKRLEGTSTVYKVPTRPVDGKELNLVVKWSRVGEVVPFDTLTVNKFIHAEFNSPFEEFSLLMELRRGDAGPPAIRVRTQRPLAIYVPGARMQDWQTGRSEDKIRTKVARHPDVEIDILRQYVVLFGWIDGLDAVETADYFTLAGRARVEFLASTTSLVMHELRQKGYRVVDMKPAHVILRPRQDQTLLRDQNGQPAYALVDYELLERTREHEEAVRSANRRIYLTHIARRFEPDADQSLPVHLRATSVLGVDYIFGRAESTGGWLWVAGRDPDLFNYFLPERWRRTPRKKLSSHNEIFYTRTKDNINLVWKVSRMGELPRLAESVAGREVAQQSGFNSPFEEFTFAIELGRQGIKTVHPRAIYMTGHKRDPNRRIADESRYVSLSHWRTPDDDPVVRREFDYLTVWGFWNAPSKLLTVPDGRSYQSLNARRALATGLISPELLAELMQSEVIRLAECGFEDLNLKPDHLLISFDSIRQPILDETGRPLVSLCNLELVRRLIQPA
jgi:hypothetical protein